MADFKKLSAVDTVETVSKSANVLIEEKGIIKKVAKDALKGATSWNDLEDKPFYEETKVVNEPLNITWDGNPEGLVSVTDVLYKISDAILTDEQIKTITETNNYNEQFVVSDHWDTMVSNNLVMPDAVGTSDCIYVRKAGVEFFEMSFPEPGIYAVSNGDYHIASITTTEPVEQTKTVIKKLDKKFLPDDAFNYDLILSFYGPVGNIPSSLENIKVIGSIINVYNKIINTEMPKVLFKVYNTSEHSTDIMQLVSVWQYGDRAVLYFLLGGGMFHIRVTITAAGEFYEVSVLNHSI